MEVEKVKRNAFFQLIYKEDGAYLKSYPPIEGGMKLSIEDIIRYLDIKNISSYNMEDVKKFVHMSSEEKNVEVKIFSGKEIAENETVFITIDPRNLLAKIRLYPPSNNGKRVSVNDVKQLLEQKGVKYGIIDKNIETALKARLYCMDILVAKAKMPVQGKNAEIVYNFNVKKTSTPALEEDGSVDFHKLDMIENVKEGQLLATLIPEVNGEPGTDVTGAVINPGKIKTKKLKFGKNITLSDDSLKIYSNVSGNVTLIDDTVFVSDVYEVPADVGPSTGDIDYDGSVEVKGNVLTGYTVKAEGDITVNGAVEGATLIAGGKIVLKRGIQGMGRGDMHAKGDIISNFIESSNAKAGGKIISDAILHSNVIAEGEISVMGKRGLIAGGSVRSAAGVKAKTIGSTMGTQTEIEVGIDPTIIDKYHAIEKNMERLSDEKAKIIQNIAILQKRLKAKGSLEEEKMMSLKQNSLRIKEIDEQMEKETEEYEILGEELDNLTGTGKIEVLDKAYPGVKMIISNVMTYLHKEAQHSAFVREGADIRIRGL